jgi:hypothetical protein
LNSDSGHDHSLYVNAGNDSLHWRIVWPGTRGSFPFLFAAVSAATWQGHQAHHYKHKLSHAR